MYKNELQNENDNILFQAPNLDKRYKATTELAELIIEMKNMEIDPKPFLKMAAQDIIMRFGPEALKATQTILKHSNSLKNSDTSYVWNEIYLILKQDLWLINSNSIN
jgi:hypothetical protein